MAPNFDVKTPAIDPRAFAEVLQHKQNAEDANMRADEERRNGRLSRILAAVQGGQQIAAGMMNLAEKREDLKAKKLAAEGQQGLIGIAGEPTPTDPTLLAEQEKRRRQNLIKANMAAMTSQMAKSEYPDSQAALERFQQSALEIKDEQGRPITVSTSFDKATGKQINPMTGQEIRGPADAKGLMPRGYAQSTRSVGYSLDGQEIVADTRTGGKFVTSFDQNGTPRVEPYTGAIYPKLENPPATFTNALAEMGNAQVLLKDITTSFDPKYVGPVAAKAGKMTKYVEALSDEQRVEFYGNVAEYKNSIIKAITGAQMSEVEAKRIIQQIPDENASPTAFLAGVKRAYGMTERRMKQMELAINRSGGVVRGENQKPISEEDLSEIVDKKLGKFSESKGDYKSWSTDDLMKRREELLKKKKV